jgi:hypothetical protein
MAQIKLPYVLWRDGRPRFIPSARERGLGFQGEDLRHKDGRWFTLDEAKLWADARYTEILQARASGRKRRPPGDRKGGTVNDLLDDWMAALESDKDRDTALSPDSIESYRKAANALRFKPETREHARERRAKARAAELLGLEPPARKVERFATTSVAAIDKIALNDFFLYVKRERGHHMAQAAIAAFSAAYTWGGLDRRWRLGANPRHELDLPRPEGRIVIYSDAELRALDAAAAALDRASIGDSIYLGVFTSQRQRDRLLLADEGLVDNRRQIRQSKTKRLVAVKETPQLAARLDAARARVAAIKLKMGTRPDTIIVDETTGETYNQDTYRHVFGEVRELAIAGSAELGLPPCPSLAGKRDQDLRDTAVTWLARAGCTMAEICAITGHSAQSVETIIKHYLGAGRELADAGIDKLVAWMQREGIAV